MAESKYGRLFTEDDVCRIVAGVLRCHGLNPETARHDAAGVLRADQSTTFPADEPLFLLRGQDGAAVPAVRDYGHRADDAGARAVHLGNVSVAALEMERWQTQHPDRVKVPD